MALLHLALSLLAFVAAFASAGFVTALVRPPPPTCGLIKCSEGGVPCSTAPAKTNRTGTTWPLDPRLVALNQVTFLSGRNASKVEVPVVMCANYAAVSGYPVSHHHNFLEAPKIFSALRGPTNLFDPCPGDPTPSTRISCWPSKSSCLFLVPQVHYDGYVYLHDHGPATWCSAEGQDSPLGASLELNGYQLHNVMKLLSYETEWLKEKYSSQSLHDIFSAFDEVFQEWFSEELAIVANVTAEQKVSDTGRCFSAMDWNDMPNVSQLLRPSGGTGDMLNFQDILVKGGGFDPGFSDNRALSGNGETSSTHLATGWNYKWDNLYGSPQLRLYVELLGGEMDFNLSSHTVIPDCLKSAAVPGTSAKTSCSPITISLPHLPASASFVHTPKPQWDTLNDTSSMALPDGFLDPKVWAEYYELLYWVAEYRGKMTEFTRGPLAGLATNYATLRYICSGGDRPVLCDKGDLSSPIEPPLAVDPNGQYLTRADIIKYSGQDISVSQTTFELQTGVIAMIVVGVVANFFTIAWLADDHIKVLLGCYR